MAADFSIKQGDLLPVFQVVLGSITGAAVNLTGASVKFVMSTGPGTTPVVNATAVVTDPVNGIVTYNWAVGDTVTPGPFDGEWKVTFASGKPQKFPTIGYNTIDIEANLGEG